MPVWTPEMKIDLLMELPWTITSEPSDEPGEIVVRVKELPGMILVGWAEYIDAEFWNALRASLEGYAHFEDRIPLPESVVGRLPWESHDVPQLVLEVRGQSQTVTPRMTGSAAPYSETQQLAIPDELAIA